MRLSRRDAIEAVLIGGGGSLIVSESMQQIGSDIDTQLSNKEIQILKKVAEIIYPSEVSVEKEFVESYVTQISKSRTTSIRSSVHNIDQHSKKFTGQRYVDLNDKRAELVLDKMGVDKAQSKPTGNEIEQIKYHIVNGLLYHLFTTPKGSRLFGIENPVGYPGGTKTLIETSEWDEP